MNEFLERAHGNNGELVQVLKQYAACLPEICQKLQEWIDDLQVSGVRLNNKSILINQWRKTTIISFLK